jgi:hypothetical protein
MDQALVRFRQAAARENRDRGSVRRRYSTRLQQQAVEYCEMRRAQGDGVRQVAAALGVAPWSLHRWIRACEERPQFHEVQVVAPARRTSDGAAVRIVTADGLRVEGPDVEAVAQLLRLLR